MQCNFEWVRGPHPYVCDLDAGHDGPNHFDSEHNDALLDENLPTPPAPPVADSMPHDVEFFPGGSDE